MKLLRHTKSGRRRLRSRLAFTLIEVIMAIGIFSLVVVAFYSTWTSVLRSSKVGLDYAAEAQRSRIAIKVIEDAVTTACLYGENSRLYAFEVEGKDGEYSAMAFTSQLGPN